MMLLTVYALYGADFNNAYGDRHTDGPMGILNFMTMLIFLIELGEFVFLFSLQKYFILLILQYMNFFLNSCSCSTFLFFLNKHQVLCHGHVQNILDEYHFGWI